MSHHVAVMHGLGLQSMGFEIPVLIYVVCSQSYIQFSRSWSPSIACQSDSLCSESREKILRSFTVSILSCISPGQYCLPWLKNILTLWQVFGRFSRRDTDTETSFFLEYYPTLIKQYGPLVGVWTMRFEANHSFFKQVARHINNFRNVLLTLSTRHQMMMAYHQQADVGKEAK